MCLLSKNLTLICFETVQMIHCPGPVTANNVGQPVRHLMDHFAQYLLLCFVQLPEYVSGHLRGFAGMADAEAQSGKVILSTEFVDDVAQTIVATVTAAFFQTDRTQRQIQFVVHHEDVCRWNAEELCESEDGLSAAIHEGGGKQKMNRMARYGDFSVVAEEFFFRLEFAVMVFGEGAKKNRAGIVACSRIFGAWITQAHDQLDRLTHAGASWAEL